MNEAFDFKESIYYKYGLIDKIDLDVLTKNISGFGHRESWKCELSLIKPGERYTYLKNLGLQHNEINRLIDNENERLQRNNVSGNKMEAAFIDIISNYLSAIIYHIINKIDNLYTQTDNKKNALIGFYKTIIFIYNQFMEGGCIKIATLKLLHELDRFDMLAKINDDLTPYFNSFKQVTSSFTIDKLSNLKDKLDKEFKLIQSGGSFDNYHMYLKYKSDYISLKTR
jgi:hypothetical protein